MTLEREIRLGLRVIIVALGGFFLWAGTIPIDEGIPAPGVLSVESKRKQVAHFTGGIIGRIHVKEGSQVRKGEVLLTLDETQAGAALGAAQQQWWTALATEARLQAEAEGRDTIEFPAELIAAKEEPAADAAMATQQEVHRTRRSAIVGELRILRESQRGLEAQLESLDTLKASRTQQVELFQKQVESARALSEQGYVSRNQTLEIERQLAEIQSRRSEDLANLSAVRARLAELRMREAQFSVTQRREAEAELAELRRDTGTLAARVAAMRDTHERLVIRAPVAGKVVDLAVTTVGGVVKPGDRVMDIVPDAEDLIVEARLDPRYVDRVYPGLPADLRFDAYMNLTMRPQVTGNVQLVSADVMHDERSGGAYYLLRVSIPSAQRQKLGEVRLQSGMLCTVLVKTGERTTLAYLLRPLLRRFSGAMSEA